MTEIVADKRWDEPIREWVSRELGQEKLGGDKFATLGIMDEGELIGGAIYHQYTGHMMEISLAAISPKWCSKKTLRAIFSYPFEQLGVTRMNAICDKKNKKIRKIMERIGFKQEGCLRKALPNGHDAIFYGMINTECKWIK